MLQRLLPIALLLLSNIFMTFAWYGHLKLLSDRPALYAILMGWGVALLEYCLAVPANRLGNKVYSLAQLKIMQEVIAMSVFAAFCVLFMKERLSVNYLWAALCMAGAVFFIFRG